MNNLLRLFNNKLTITAVYMAGNTLYEPLRRLSLQLILQDPRRTQLTLDPINKISPLVQYEGYFKLSTGSILPLRISSTLGST
jgi:hypothetical protein